MSDWTEMDSLCMYCGARIEGRPLSRPGVVITGFEPMEYRHVGGNSECVMTYRRTVRPYTGRGQYQDWAKRRSEANL